MKRLPMGPVMADVAGQELTPEEAEFLRHPAIGAVILFARNYESPEQLKKLTASIRGLREPQLLIAVDHEGGRVQRFRQGFTAIPSMKKLGELHAREPHAGLRAAQAVGLVIGTELLSHGVDFSFTPVLDVDFGHSVVIGDRAFSADPAVVTALAGALCDGLDAAGSASVGKHFPGHGFVGADSHVAIPVDEREWRDIDAGDLAPYRALAKRLDGIMPAHVIYPRLDALPAGFSRFWLQDVLRKQIGFDGMIFSDDLSMEGASVAGDVVARGRAAFDAGCDMVLVCNAPEEARRLVDGLGINLPVLDPQRAERMRGTVLLSTTALASAGYAKAVEQVKRLSA
jgi:beta-N-acetylhexosaminidase